MDDEVAFAKARLDEDKTAAAAAIGGIEGAGDWHVSRQGTLDSSAASGDPSVGCPDGCHPSDAQNDHIARHDPARALREVEAGFRILDRHRECATMSGYCRDRHVGPPPCPDLADLLSRWSVHPDYRPEWKP